MARELANVSGRARKFEPWSVPRRCSRTQLVTLGLPMHRLWRPCEIPMGVAIVVSVSRGIIVLLAFMNAWWDVLSDPLRELKAW